MIRNEHWQPNVPTVAQIGAHNTWWFRSYRNHCAESVLDVVELALRNGVVYEDGQPLASHVGETWCGTTQANERWCAFAIVNGLPESVAVPT